jgi:hypothetical protein
VSVPRWALCAVWSESELAGLGGMEHQRARRGAVGAEVGAETLVPGRVLMATVPTPSVPLPTVPVPSVPLARRGAVGAVVCAAPLVPGRVLMASVPKPSVPLPSVPVPTGPPEPRPTGSTWRRSWQFKQPSATQKLVHG